MEKLDFATNLESLRDLIKSKEIVKFIDGLSTTGGVDCKPLTPLLIEAKSNYDRIPPNDPKKAIIEGASGTKYFSEQVISDLVNELLQSQGQGKSYLFLKMDFMKFYHFHKTIVETMEVTDKVLFNGKRLTYSLDNVLVFHVISHENGMSIGDYIKVLSLINELLQIIEEILGVEKPSSNKLTLLDSGSGTNIGLESSIEFVKSAFQLFQTIFEWLVARKFYKEKLRDAAVLEKIKILVALKDAETKGAIATERAKILNETLLRRTEELLDMQVLPKTLVTSANIDSTRQLLVEHSEAKLLN